MTAITVILTKYQLVITVLCAECMTNIYKYKQVRAFLLTGLLMRSIISYYGTAFCFFFLMRYKYG